MLSEGRYLYVTFPEGYKGIIKDLELNPYTDHYYYYPIVEYRKTGKPIYYHEVHIVPKGLIHSPVVYVFSQDENEEINEEFVRIGTKRLVIDISNGEYVHPII